MKFYVIFGKKIIMSRIGKLPVLLPKGVSVNRNDENIIIKGPHGLLEREIPSIMDVEILEDRLLIKPNVESRIAKQFHGLFRTLINNMVIGVSDGFEKKLELKGVGYRAKASGQLLELTLGFSHPVKYQLPEDVKVETPSQTEVVLKSFNKQILGQAAAEIRSFRPPEPYKGKGVRYSDENVRRKEAKKAAGA